MLGASRNRLLLFLPGFLASPAAYRELLDPVSGPDLTVFVPQLYFPSPRVLMGRYCVADEARAAADLVGDRQGLGVDVWLGGHSRGGQAAWIAASLLERAGHPCTGLILIDPVDGAGPRSSAPKATAKVAVFGGRPLIVGAGIGGPCAPQALNHYRFARAAPSSLHLVVADMGHADVLVGWNLTVGRRLCGGGRNPQQARRTVTDLIDDYLSGALSETSDLPPGVSWC